MRKKNKVITISIILIIALYIFLIWKDNIKLSLTRFWWYFTIENNALLKKYDKDLIDLKNTNKEPRIDLKNLLSWWPWKDWIPSIDNPIFENLDETKFKDEEIIVWVFMHWEARAYPYWILNWHEIVNDKIWDTPITITLCPLCDTNPVFIRKINWVETTFWVSWKLFQSCLVMYDRLTDTLWSQPWGIWIAWDNTNRALKRVPATKTTLWKWKEKYPNSKVLSTKTWHRRNYFKYPYWSYYTNKEIIFPARNQSKLNVHPKEIESYIWTTGNKTPKNLFNWESFHISHKEMKKLKEKNINYLWKTVKVLWDNDLQTVVFLSSDKQIPSSTSFWFVYPAFFE